MSRSDEDISIVMVLDDYNPVHVPMSRVLGEDSAVLDLW